MDGRLFVVAAVLLSFCPGIFGDSKLKTVRAFTGESVILPCITDIFDDTTTVMWSKVGLRKYVLLFNQDVEIHEEKDPVFQYRSSLIMDELKNGNVSVRISDLKLSDAGNYTCMTIHKKIPRSTVIELIVGAVSEPKLSVVPSTDAGVTLQCEVQCWFPKPDITFLDDAGKEMSAQDEKTERHPEGCFSVTRRVTLGTTTNSVTCKVNEQSLNQSKADKFVMPVFRTSYTNIIIAIVVSAVIVCFSILGAAFFCVKYKGGQQLTVSQKFVACAACWSSEENQADGDDAVDDNSPDQQPLNNEEVLQPQTEQPNENHLRLDPYEDSGNISGNGQAVVQRFSTRSLPTEISDFCFAFSFPQGRRDDACLTIKALSQPNNTETFLRCNLSDLSSLSYNPPKQSEEEENPLLSTNP